MTTCSRYNAATLECYIAGYGTSLSHIMQSTMGKSTVLPSSILLMLRDKQGSAKYHFKVFSMTWLGIEPTTYYLKWKTFRYQRYLMPANRFVRGFIIQIILPSTRNDSEYILVIMTYPQFTSLKVL